MDFLAIADQANHHRPIVPARHDVEQMAGFRVGQPHLAGLALGDRVGAGPGSLRLVDHDDVLGRQMVAVLDIVVAKAG